MRCAEGTANHFNSSIQNIFCEHSETQNKTIKTFLEQNGISLQYSLEQETVFKIINKIELKTQLWPFHYFNYIYNMMTSSNGNIFRVTGPLCGEFTGPGEFPAQWSVTRSLDVFFDLRLNKRLSKQSWDWWFETPSWSLWWQCNENVSSYTCITTNLFDLKSIA